MPNAPSTEPPGPVLLSLTCTLLRSTSAVSCTTIAPARATGVASSASNSRTVSYAAFLPNRVVEDTVAHTWAFTAHLQNLLGQAIGTPNGTTVTGERLFVTDLQATPGTDFPAEQTVTLAPPDTIPAWVRSDTNISSDRFAKRIVLVEFRPTATLADRQLAIALVNGVVVGGRRWSDGVRGTYYVKVADDGTGDAILTAAKALTALPQVQFASFEVLLDPLDAG